MVLVNSICSEVLGGVNLVWVTISHGTTQWARWQANTGDPNTVGNLPEPPEPDRSYTRSDLGIRQEAPLPEGLLGDGINGLEAWQKDIPFKRLIDTKERKWSILPCDLDAAAYKPWLLQFAMETTSREPPSP